MPGDAARRLRAADSWTACVLASVGLLVLVLGYIGAPPIIAPWDVLVLLDGAWRIHIGQIPHQDFYNPIGPLTYQLVALGMSLSGPSLVSVSHGVLLFLLLVTPWAWTVSSSRLPKWLAALFTIYVAVLVCSLRPLGYTPEITSYAMLYNRLGWVLISILFVQVFLEPQASSRQKPVAEGLSVGALLGLLFFCKVTYFATGAAGVGLALVLRPDLRRSLVAAGLAFAALCAVWWIAFDISAIRYLADLLSAARAQSSEHRVLWLLNSLSFNKIALAVLAAAALTSVAVAGRRAYVTTVIVVFVTAVTFAIASANAPERNDLPLLLVALLISLRFLGIDSPSKDDAPSRYGYWALCLIGIPLLIGQTVLSDLASLYHAGRNKSAHQVAAPSQKIDSAVLGDFHILATSKWRTAYWIANEVPAKLNDGLSLLRRHGLEKTRVLPMAFGNPFSLALQSTPPTGAPLWWDLGFSLASHRLPKPEAIFRDVDTVIYPILRDSDKGCCHATVSLMLTAYKPFIEKEFTQQAVSEFWVIRSRSGLGRPL
jgi:hypothetical protein